MSNRVEWKIVNYFLQKYSQYQEFINSRAAIVGNGTVIHKEARIINMQNSIKKITVGKYTHIRGDLVVFASGGKITIGDNCYIGEDSKIWSQDEIKIGNNVLIAHNVNIHDTNSHPINFLERRKDYSEIITSGFSKNNMSITCKRILIEDDVWIGFNSIILKGVEIGARSIVASGSVVTNTVPSDVIVAGNPAIIIKTIEQTMEDNLFVKPF
jgi:acetyltransferase-like isoleucine patch superfamily enzyme